jgi:hypothetical protein
MSDAQNTLIDKAEAAINLDPYAPLAEHAEALIAALRAARARVAELEALRFQALALTDAAFNYGDSDYAHDKGVDLLDEAKHYYEAQIARSQKEQVTPESIIDHTRSTMRAERNDDGSVTVSADGSI